MRFSKHPRSPCAKQQPVGKFLVVVFLLVAPVASSEPTSAPVWTVDIGYNAHAVQFVDGKILVLTGDTLGAINRHNGELLWKTTLGYETHWNPKMIAYHTDVYVGIDQLLVRVDASTGEVVWKRHGLGWPIYADDQFVAGVTLTEPSATAAGGALTDLFLASAIDGSKHWVFEPGGMAGDGTLAQQALVDGSILLYRSEKLYRINLTTGNAISSPERKGEAAFYFHEGVYIEEAPLGSFPDGSEAKLFQVDADLQPTEVYSWNSKPSRFFDSLLRNEEIVVVYWKAVATRSLVQAIDVETSTLLWTREIEEFPALRWIVGERIVHVGEAFEDGELLGHVRFRALDFAGESVWAFDARGVNGADVEGDQLAAAVYGPVLMSIDAKTGSHKDDVASDLGLHFLPLTLIACGIVLYVRRGRACMGLR